MAETVNTNSYKPNLEIFSETLQRLAIDDRDIVAVTSDSRGSGKLGPFGVKFPAQIVNGRLRRNRIEHSPLLRLDAHL